MKKTDANKDFGHGARMLLEKYYAGESSRAEEEELMCLVRDMPRDVDEELARELRIYRDMRLALSCAAGELEDSMPDWLMPCLEEMIEPARSLRGLVGGMRSVWWSAAVIALALTCGLMAYHNKTDDRGLDVTAEVKTEAPANVETTQKISAPATPATPALVASAKREAAAPQRVVADKRENRAEKAEPAMMLDEETIREKLRLAGDDYGVELQPLLCYQNCDEQRGMTLREVTDETLREVNSEMQQFSLVLGEPMHNRGEGTDGTMAP